jgi:hypothetical protein
MRTLLLTLLAAAFAAAQQPPNTLTQKEIDDGWILLFDGESLFGWQPQGTAEWMVENGAITTKPGPYGWLRSGSQFADYQLKLEFRACENCNSGVFLRSATNGQPHVTGYELQIWTGNAKFPTGSLVNHATAKAKFNGDVWNQYDVTLQGDHFVVKLNGKTVLDAHDGKSKVGHIGLQSNKDKIEFRNMKLKPLGLTALFDGKSLAGWHEVKTPRAKEPPEWTAQKGAIHVEKGPGQLETDATFDDVILQLWIRTNPKDEKHHPNSGVFLRGEPNDFWTGYEIQIRNEYKDGDRSKAVDFGTGGMYFYQPARKVLGDDGKFFVETIVARGRHFGTWVNGYPIADWEDPHPEGKSVRDKQARLGAGVISLQAHDPTTNLDFKNIKAVRLPK